MVGLEGASPARTPEVAAKEETRVIAREREKDSQVLRPEKAATMLRAVSALPNCLSLHHLRNDEIVLQDVSIENPGSAEVEESGASPCMACWTRVGHLIKAWTKQQSTRQGPV